MELFEFFLRALNLEQDSPSTGKIKEVWLMECDADAFHLLVDNMPQMIVFCNLTHLRFMCSDLKSDTCNLLSMCPDFLQHLEHLELSATHIGSGGAVNLITSLAKFSTIRELDLQTTRIGFEDCKALSEFLATSKFIQVLNIGGNDLSSDSIQLIVDGLSHNTSLERLEMSNTSLSSENLLHLASVLRVNSSLKELDNRDYGNCLSHNLIESEGAVAFADMLATNKSLTELDMSGCSIQGEGAVYLAKAIEKNSTVRELCICSSIGSERAGAFASMVKKNQCLRKLSLQDVSFGVEGALELIKSLKHNTTLEKLELLKKCKPPSFSTLDKTLQDRVNFW